MKSISVSISKHPTSSSYVGLMNQMDEKIRKWYSQGHGYNSSVDLHESDQEIVWTFKADNWRRFFGVLQIQAHFGEIDQKQIEEFFAIPCRFSAFHPREKFRKTLFHPRLDLIFPFELGGLVYNVYAWIDYNDNLIHVKLKNKDESGQYLFSETSDVIFLLEKNMCVEHINFNRELTGFQESLKVLQSLFVQVAVHPARDSILYEVFSR